MITYILAFAHFIFYGLVSFAVAYEVMILMATDKFLAFYKEMDESHIKDLTTIQRVYMLLTAGYGLWLVVGIIFMHNRLVYAAIALVAIITDKRRRTDKDWLRADAIVTLLLLSYLISLTI